MWMWNYFCFQLQRNSNIRATMVSGLRRAPSKWRANAWSNPTVMLKTVRRHYIRLRPPGRRREPGTSWERLKMMANKRIFLIKCFVILLVMYIFVYLVSSSGTTNIIKSLQQSGRNLAAMEPQIQQIEQQQRQIPPLSSSTSISVEKATTTKEQQTKDVANLSVLSTVKTSSVSERVRQVTGCVDKPRRTITQQRGDYWVFYNYIPAKRTFSCDETITYTTHADYSFLDNLVPLVEKWKGPISLAMHAPGTDFKNTLDSLWYLRDCTTPLVKELVTFHLYFSTKHIPKEVGKILWWKLILKLV